VPEYLETTIDKFVFRVAADRLYSSEGVWALREGDKVRVGLTDFVQQRGGDAAFVHVQPVGSILIGGMEFAEIETIKANLSLLLPIGGTIVEVNSNLETAPESINEDPYGKGWLAVIGETDWESRRGKLLAPHAYLSVMQTQAEQELKG
jgi:glycine cleavage system H protein